MSVFTPNRYLEKITRITPSFLKKQGIRGLILDIDNTLTYHNSPEIGCDILDWLDLMRQCGIKMTVVSNNNKPRVAPFAAKLGLDYVANGCKPLPFGMYTAIRRLSLPKEAIAVVGDQIYTDMIGGNLAGLFTILVQPFQTEDNLFFSVKRKLEAIHLKKVPLCKGDVLE